MTDANLRQKALATHKLLERYYVDDSDQVVNGHNINQYNTVLGMITYATAGRQLLKGDPGSGKTSIAGTLCGVIGGTPPEVAAQTLVKGTPGLSEEDISGRLHYGKMSQGEEYIVWHLRHTLPFFNVDELLRVPTKKQSYLLTGVEQGHWEVIDYPLDVYPAHVAAAPGPEPGSRVGHGLPRRRQPHYPNAR